MEVRSRKLTSHDGTRIAAFDSGRKGPWVLLANGLGGNITAWNHQLAYFQDSFRLASWDYRGLYQSGPPANGSCSIEDQVRDALVVMDEYGIEDTIVMGWSMGVQVSLELYRQMPDRVRGLILLNGTNGVPVKKLITGLGPLFEGALRVFSWGMPRLRPLARPLMRTSIPIRVIKNSGFISPTLDETIFAPLAKDWTELDFGLYSETFRQLGLHDARALLPQIRVPTLVVTGGRDFITPHWMGRQMAAAIPGAEHTHVPEASHYTCVEFPDLVNVRMDRFLTEHNLID